MSSDSCGVASGGVSVDPSGFEWPDGVNVSHEVSGHHHCHGRLLVLRNGDLDLLDFFFKKNL